MVDKNLHHEPIKHITQKKYKNCQNCSRPFNKHLQHGATNAEESKNQMYYSKCYMTAKFKQADMIAAEMQAFLKGKMKEMGGVFGLCAGLIAKGIPQLERWKKTKLIAQNY